MKKGNATICVCILFMIIISCSGKVDLPSEGETGLTSTELSVQTESTPPTNQPLNKPQLPMVYLDYPRIVYNSPGGDYDNYYVLPAGEELYVFGKVETDQPLWCGWLEVGYIEDGVESIDGYILSGYDPSAIEDDLVSPSEFEEGLLTLTVDCEDIPIIDNISIGAEFSDTWGYIEEGFKRHLYESPPLLGGFLPDGASIIEELDESSTIEILGMINYPGQYCGWLHVRTESGAEGWIMSGIENDYGFIDSEFPYHVNGWVYINKDCSEVPLVEYQISSTPDSGLLYQEDLFTISKSPNFLTIVNQTKHDALIVLVANPSFFDAISNYKPEWAFPTNQDGVPIATNPIFVRANDIVEISGLNIGEYYIYISLGAGFLPYELRFQDPLNYICLENLIVFPCFTSIGVGKTCEAHETLIIGETEAGELTGFNYIMVAEDEFPVP